MQNNLLNGISSFAVNPQTDSNSVIQMLKDSLNTDIQKVQLLMQNGVINNMQGQIMLALLAKKANEINSIDNLFPVQNVTQAPQQQKEKPQEDPANPFDAFNAENPGFFEKAGRGEVFNYIKNLEMDKDEISKIANLVELLENSAIDSYLKQSTHEKSMNDENTIAKSKLMAYAQNSPKNSDFERIFTRADIGKMSGEEYAKNEKIIAEQAKLGLIK